MGVARVALPAVTVLCLACGRSGSDSRPASARYVLRSIGGQPLRAGDSGSACQDQPRGGAYVLTGARWAHVDTVGPCLAADRFDAVVRRDSGTFQLRGDTIALSVADRQIGEEGLVGLGLLRGDTLVLWGSDVDGGDYVYVREAP
jgi:hypothetical protein